ncbi:hypothetical protein GIB67_013300 [Kingdonia uniflora]|uniref:DUF506 family protein n=1 Tax=Kingdonia uniflora TaxID=39325 RepID=A0A7J7LQV1_9MAGN|nr:hypothetical protein GIB67_013300 [Kingdonia uniflora]
MAKISLRYKRVREAFEEGSKARPCSEEISGSDHSTKTEDLFDLINSYYETQTQLFFDDLQTNSNDPFHVFHPEAKAKQTLKRMLGHNEDDIKRSIVDEVELALRYIGSVSGISEEGFKRRLMTRLRERGLDAGLCKAQWEQTERYTSGKYDYVDVIVGGTRYIVETLLVGEFTIARPTKSYQSLLEVFPQVYVGKPDELKQVARIMCRAIKESMKSSDLHIPPWRRKAYMQAKWLGSYERITNNVVEKGAVPLMPYCRDEFVVVGGGKVGFRVGRISHGVSRDLIVGQT